MNHILDKDTQLMLKFQQGNLKSYIQLCKKHRPGIIYFVRGFSQRIITKEIAEDISQKTFIRVYTHKDFYKPIAQFNTWLYTIAGNFARTEIRKFRRKPTVGLTKFITLKPGLPKIFIDNDIIDPDAEDPAKIKDYSNAIKEIARCAEEGHPYFTPFLLRDMQELSYYDISSILNIPLGTVKSRINRCRTSLADRISRNGI